MLFKTAVCFCFTVCDEHNMAHVELVTWMFEPVINKQKQQDLSPQCCKWKTFTT